MVMLPPSHAGVVAKVRANWSDGASGRIHLMVEVLLMTMMGRWKRRLIQTSDSYNTGIINFRQYAGRADVFVSDATKSVAGLVCRYIYTPWCSQPWQGGFKPCSRSFRVRR